MYLGFFHSSKNICSELNKKQALKKKSRPVFFLDRIRPLSHMDKSCFGMAEVPLLAKLCVADSKEQVLTA